jgi:hypothetical protein
MQSTRKDAILYSTYVSRIEASEAIAAVLQGAASADALIGAASRLSASAERFQESAAGVRYRQFAILVNALSFLVRWVTAVRSAEIDADRFLRSAKVAVRESTRVGAGAPDSQDLTAIVSRIFEISDVDQVPDVARLLLCFPLPLPMLVEVHAPMLARRGAPPELSRSEIVVAFASFQIDGIQFLDPHTIRPGVLHDLKVNLTVSQWPDQAKELVLEVMSVEPATAYDLPRFSFQRPTGQSPYSVEQTGRLLLQYPLAFYARPLQFTYRARFSPETAEAQVVVQGHRQLRVQCFDPTCEPQSGYSLVDGRVLQIRDELRRVITIDDNELNDFLLLMTVVGGIAGQSLQDNIFDRIYSEAEFQDEMKRLLRRDPRVGSQLEEHPHAARGITDLSFRGIRLELKVEPDRFVTEDDASRFLPQTAQYVAGSDRRCGMLAVLDCSSKSEAPGTVDNDIFVKPVPPPNGPAGLPICVGVVIIRGNLAKPSRLSANRRA